MPRLALPCGAACAAVLFILDRLIYYLPTGLPTCPQQAPATVLAAFCLQTLQSLEFSLQSEQVAWLAESLMPAGWPATVDRQTADR